MHIKVREAELRFYREDAKQVTIIRPHNLFSVVLIIVVHSFQINTIQKCSLKFVFININKKIKH
jgi:hypothetical protein